MYQQDHLNRKMFGFTFVLVMVIILYFLLAAIPPQPAKKPEKPAVSEKPVTATSGIAERSAAISGFGQFVYGKSGLGKNLMCYKIAPTTPVKGKILMTFEIHGFEDQAPRDGQVLVNIGNAVVNYFSRHRSLLNGCELYIVPSANPDALQYGTSMNGKGRCQISLGVDINRDFDYNFITITSSRNKTLNKPFSAPESQGLRDLTEAIKPNIVVDDHGWLNEFIGNTQIADSFKQSLGMSGSSVLAFDSTIHGYFSAWATTQGAKGMLLEYPVIAMTETPRYITGTEAGVQNLTKIAIG